MSDDPWRQQVEAALADGRKRFDALEERATKIESAVTTNTSLTQRAVDVSVSTEKKLDEMRTEVQPVTDAVRTMEAGIRTIGRVGDAGAKLGKALLVFGMIGGVVKLTFSGASWSEVYGAFLRAIGK